MSYKPNHPIKIVTAASLFDGHDASINIMRRILQDMGAEVIHLGHNRSVNEVVDCALQEGAQGICISSYQGGHMEYFKYMRDLLNDSGASYVKIFGGGGGVIVHEEKSELEAYGISHIFHPDDGRKLGLEGMIELVIKGCDFDINQAAESVASFEVKDETKFRQREMGLYLSAIENGRKYNSDFLEKNVFIGKSEKPKILGITGTGGAGKSSLVDELIQRFLNGFEDIKIAVICVDPSKRKTGGALLGDRIRMNSLSRDGVYMRSLASRGSGNEIATALPEVLRQCQSMDFDLIIAESSGIGQASMAITEVSDFSLYVMTSEFGAQSQLEKIEMIDYADIIAINKADRRGSLDAFRDVKKQYRRSRKLFDESIEIPVFLTQASNFNDNGVNQLFFGITDALAGADKGGFNWVLPLEKKDLFIGNEKQTVVPPERQNYLSEIVSAIRSYKKQTETLAEVASEWGALEKAEKVLGEPNKFGKNKEQLKSQMSGDDVELLDSYEKNLTKFQGQNYEYSVRGKVIKQPLTHKSLSGLDVPRIALPEIKDWGDRFRFLRLENFPGEFPYTSGVFPLKRLGELPARQFAGEGPPERTNRRFHYLSKDEAAKRLSTAFDSVTLYGQDPNIRPDIYGKVGESGVSIATLDDMKALYDGFDLCDPSTSVSMTINGPAPMLLAFFMNTAIDQQVEKKEKDLGRSLSDHELEETRAWVLKNVRGTVQADILKEDQGQNTCIFSIDFAIKMMGDIQQYFIEHQVKNFYSVSISGYHIAEAGANPITQLALTLSNAFTYVEYYLSRGMDIDDFAPSLSFFFSNGLDAEYTVIGRVARRIWAVAMRDLYKANDRSQKLKYHIQTSGRSLHAQEIDFNDIRTTLQALVAISDNCNSLHTNAYDEAITTPTEESVRRAQAIQLIINKEYGYSKNENPLQGSYFVNWLTDAVEEAVLDEFNRISERGGVLGAMETQYQRGKIQEESMYYEHLKHSGDHPVVGVNTFINPKTLGDDYVPPKIELARASQEEKKMQLDRVEEYQSSHSMEAEREIQKLKESALKGENVFGALMSAARHCTLFQMTTALYEVGGQYRRNL
tara:strand:- start:160286 stop:163525 length:3240 start_codon:yes stop_codon:yes gene_type:complete